MAESNNNQLSNQKILLVLQSAKKRSRNYRTTQAQKQKRSNRKNNPQQANIGTSYQLENAISRRKDTHITRKYKTWMGSRRCITPRGKFLKYLEYLVLYYVTYTSVKYPHNRA